jgi:hypothetical protein
MLLAGAVAFARATIVPFGVRNLLADLRQFAKLSDMLDLIFSGIKGDFRLALVTVAVMIAGRHLRAAIARRLRSAGQGRGSIAPLVLPQWRDAALAA